VVSFYFLFLKEEVSFPLSLGERARERGESIFKIGML
jgi:hypothetical protein